MARKPSEAKRRKAGTTSTFSTLTGGAQRRQAKRMKAGTTPQLKKQARQQKKQAAQQPKAKSGCAVVALAMLGIPAALVVTAGFAAAQLLS